MCGGFGRVALSARGLVLVLLLFSGGCTAKAEAVRAAQPYIEDFRELRLRALSLLELRSDVQRQRVQLGAIGARYDRYLQPRLR